MCGFDGNSSPSAGRSSSTPHRDRVAALVTAEVACEGVYLEVVGETGQPQIARVHVKVFAASSDEPGLRRLWSELPDRLPLVCTMRSAFSVDLELVTT